MVRRTSQAEAEPPPETEEPHHTLGLEVMSDAVRYRRYLLDLLEPHCGPAILEVGSGLGDLAEGLAGYERLVVTDVDPVCLAELAKRFAGRTDVEVRPFDLREDHRVTTPVDTVLAVNVLEHIEDDEAALRRMTAEVLPGGTVVLFVPAYPSLYGPHDRAAGHVRRYTPQSLRAAVVASGLAVEVLHPVNFLGGVAWWVAVRVGGCSSPRSRLVGVYDRFVVPVVRLMERRWKPPFGQSIVCVARVPNGSDGISDGASPGASVR
jgi:2-polyprenyl-3-methyl-5-hydroxy-6-metoxy-1,4-benzoquinol methylase